MTSKEVLEDIKGYLLDREIQVLEELVERDTPKKPAPQFPNTTFMYWCPECGCSSIQRYNKHCHNCGQRLDWS